MSDLLLCTGEGQEGMEEYVKDDDVVGIEMRVNAHAHL